MTPLQPNTSSTDLARPNRIRVETAFSRFPIHCLARKGSVIIDLQRLNEAGVADFKWEVTFNSKHGPPGPLAYKVDTLVVNRVLDQLGRPLPEIVRIGSLSDVCRSLGTQDTGPNIANVKSAFQQNASAFIDAKMRYKMKNGREKWTEVSYTRYSVVFTGEALPDGSQADAVHIVLNLPYREFLNHVETRPLDYDYLMKLPPGPQRFYELMSFQIYGAVAGGRPRARFLYSDYCKYAPQVRYFDFDHVKKQMYKLGLRHRESGYVAKVAYQETIDPEGKPDWEMFYTPGPKAFAEYEAFTNRQTHHSMLIGATVCPVTRHSHQPRKPAQAALGFAESNNDLLTELTKRGIAEATAHNLLVNIKPGQEVLDQVEYVDSLIAKDKRCKFENPPGLYVHYVRSNISPPADFHSSRNAKRHDQLQQLQKADLAHRAQLELDYADYRDAQINKFAEALPADEYQRMFKEERWALRGIYKSMTPAQLDDVTHRSVRGQLIKSGRVPLLPLEEFIQRQTNSA